MDVDHHVRAKFGRIARALFAAALLLNGGAPLMPAASAAPVDGDLSQHLGHDMADMPGMAMAGDSDGQSPADCCDDGSMNCHCGCVAQQPGAPNFVVTIRTGEGAPERVVTSISSHISSPLTTPFRPPA